MSRLLRLALESLSQRTKSVYVVELSKDVLHIKKFMDRNPNYIHGKPCVYVGMTGLDPVVRFKKHKDGIKANTYVQKYGQKLLPSVYASYNPMTFDEAVKKEKELSDELRKKGWGVWYG